MNQQEQQLILALNDRIRQAHPVAQKDVQAEQLIRDTIGSQPDGLYLLVQAVVMQEQAIRELQQQVAQLQQNTQSKGFLGGLFGRRQTNYQQAMYQQAPYQQPMYQQGYNNGPSFLGSALTTAAGVAGGMFLFQGLNSLFSGPSAADMGNQANFADPTATDPFSGQDQMLDNGFGNGDDFMGGGGGFDDSNFGSW